MKTNSNTKSTPSSNNKSKSKRIVSRVDGSTLGYMTLEEVLGTDEYNVFLNGEELIVVEQNSTTKIEHN